MTARAAEVAVIGGGVIGCAVAWRLARAGADVVLLEAVDVAAGSSSRGAGGVRAQWPDPLEVRLSLESIAFYLRAEDELGVPPPIARHGYLYLASDADELRRLEAATAAARRLGVQIRTLDAATLADLVPGLRTDDLVGGLLGPDDGYGDPAAATRAFGAAARRAGATVRTGAAVTGADVRDGRIHAVCVGAERIAVGAVVLATGAWSAGVGRLFGVELPVRPLRRQLVRTTRVPGLPASVPMTIEAATGFHFRREGSGLLLAGPGGAALDTFDLEPDAGAVADVLVRAVRRWPRLHGIGVDAVRAGLYELTPDARPLLGRHPACPDLVLCCGFSGHGFMHAPAASRLACAVTLGQTPDPALDAYAPDRFDGLAAPPTPVVL